MSSPRFTTNLNEDPRRHWRLPAPAPTSPVRRSAFELPRGETDYVDPEHGCADLRGERGRPDSPQSTNCVLQQ